MQPLEIAIAIIGLVFLVVIPCVFMWSILKIASECGGDE